MSESIKDLDLDKIKNTFPYYPSLIYVIIGLILIYASIDGFLTTYIEDKWIRLIVYTALILIWVGFWLYHRNNPSKNVKEKIGIVLCVKTENDKQKIRLKNDFVSRMWELIHSHNLDDLLNIIQLNEYHTEKLYNIIVKYNKLGINDKVVQSRHPIRKKWVKIGNKINGQFYIWGNIKERLDKESNYIFNLEGMVLHPPLNPNSINPFNKAFAMVWARRISFKESLETEGFIIAADVIMLGVKYIIGLAAFISKDAINALKIHEGLLNDFENYKSLPPNLIEVRKELIINLIDECHVIARGYYIQNNEEKAKEYLNKSFKHDPNNYHGLALKSIFDFVFDKDPNEAIKTCYKAKKYAKKDGTWKYNLAFLLMYLEKFEEALQWYKNIKNNFYENESVPLEEVYQFNRELISSNPLYIQSHFIIGYLKYNKSDNYPESLEHLTTFVEKSKNEEKYNCLIVEAKKLIKEINRKMSL